MPGPSPERSLSLHELVAGAEVTRALWLGLTAPERKRLALELGAFLRALHGVDVETGRRCGLPEANHGTQAAKLRRRLREPGGTFVPREPRGALEDALGVFEARLVSAPAAAALLHGDLGPGHVLVDPEPGELTGIIDWGDAMIGDVVDQLEWTVRAAQEARAAEVDHGVRALAQAVLDLEAAGGPEPWPEGMELGGWSVP